jgi:hypothetical protein
MKKVYIAPQTEAMELIASGILMASIGGGAISVNETATSGYGD